MEADSETDVFAVRNSAAKGDAMKKRAQYVWTALAVMVVVAACAGIVLAPLAHNVVHAQGVGLSEYMYITFEDDFENPAWTACNWMYYDGACNVVADAGGNKVMHLVDTDGPTGIAWVKAQKSREFLTDHFVIRSRVRLNAPGDRPWENDAGIAWAVQPWEPGNEYASYSLGFVITPGDPSATGIALVQFVGGESQILAAYLTPIDYGVWHEVEVRSSATAYEVSLDGLRVFETPHTPAWNSGPVCAWADCDADFDEFHLEARPANPGKLAVTRADWESMDSADIWLMAADGTNQLRLTHEPGYVSSLCSWSPDGARLVFKRATFDPLQHEASGEALGLYVMDSDGLNQANISAVAGDPSDVHSAWSPDGAWIAFATNRDGDREVYKMRPDGTNPINLTNSPTGDDDDPTWSPDGRRLAFDSTRSGDFEVWAMDADGSGLRNLTNAPGSHEGLPSWSPDGTKIAFVSTRVGGFQLFVMDADGSNQQQLTWIAGAPVMMWHPRWSPDGLKLAVYCEWEHPGLPGGSSYTLHVLNADGSNCVQVTPQDDIYAGSFWYPLEPQYPRQVSIPSVWGTPGLALAVPIYVTPVRDVCGIQIDLRYDPSLLTPVDVTPGELISSLPGWEVATHFDSGRAQAIVYNSLATPVYGGSGPIMYVNFLANPAAANGASCALDLANVILADASGNALPMDAVWDGLFTVSALHHFAFDTIPSPQGADMDNPRAFPVHIRALDESDQLCVAYSNAVDLSDLLVGALGTAHFADGEWSGQIALHSLTGRLADVITATDPTLGVSSNSNAFDVILKGSVNGDQMVNVLDVMKTVNIILGYVTPPGWQYWAANVNSDEGVNVQDIILIINKIFSASAMMRPAGVAALPAPSAQASAEPVVVDAEWGKSPAGNPVMAITLSNAAGVAGAQVDVTYDTKRVKGVTARAGTLIASNPGWSVYANGAGSKVRALAFSGSAQGLTAGKGSIIELEFEAKGKGNLADIAAVTLTDGSGRAIPTRIAGAGKPGHK